MTKICSQCKFDLDVSCFYKAKHHKDGLRSCCKSCHSGKASDYYVKNKDKVDARNAAYRNSDPGRENRRISEWEAKNPEKVEARKRRFDERHPGARAAYRAKRRASQLRATPKWADIKAIRNFYDNCPVGYEVDHIVPLQNKFVSGLHVLNNLQYLPMLENRKKSNKFNLKEGI